mgnify:CR=1 FL=1
MNLSTEEIFFLHRCLYLNGWFHISERDMSSSERQLINKIKKLSSKKLMELKQ